MLIKIRFKQRQILKFKIYSLHFMVNPHQLILGTHKTRLYLQEPKYSSWINSRKELL